jgi:hypothetical protein
LCQIKKAEKQKILFKAPDSEDFVEVESREEFVSQIKVIQLKEIFKP